MVGLTRLAVQHEDIGETVVEALPLGWTQHSRGDDPVVCHPDEHGRQQSMLALQFIDIRPEFPQLLRSPAHGGRPGPKTI